MKQLPRKAVWLFYFNYVLAIPVMAVVLWLLIVLSLSDISLDRIDNIFSLSGIIVFIVQNWWLILIFLVLLCYVWAYLSWKYYKYELRDGEFRKEHGVIWKNYVSIPYEHIQNVDIYRGLLARILGLSDLHIQTAGMNDTGGRNRNSEGRLPGLAREEAEKLRDELIKRAGGKKN